MPAHPAATPCPTAGAPRTVAVVGGGVAGLAAAWQLVTSDPALRVVLLEGSPRVGGRLAAGDLGGVSVDLGAESLLARRPEAVELATDVGLADDLEPPRAVGAQIWSRGARHPLPAATLMGVPSSADAVRSLVGAAEAARVAGEPSRDWPPVEADDLDVATFVASRVGRGVVDRLVEPLLGGVYAGHAGGLSLRATVPALWDAATTDTSVVEAAATAAERGAATRAPVFTGVRGGVGRLPLAVASALTARGADVRTGTTVRRLERRPGGWRLVSGPTTHEVALDVDAVVLAVPAAAASRLLRDVAPTAAGELAAVEYASVALVSWLLRRDAVAGLEGSGLLVPPVDGRYVKAATFSSSKWAWLDGSAPDHVVVRASVGRHGGEADLQVDDDELARRALADLRDVPGVLLPEPDAVLVSRWGGGLPQYAPGHVDLVERVLTAVAAQPGLAVAGAAYEGVGVPACVASGRRAAAQVLAHLTGHLADGVSEG